ncbi:MAG: hypothetical protein MRZ37_05310 [Tenericutes bacterium]|nr:hypothetical protein [Mycoplasmatota bacterium]
MKIKNYLSKHKKLFVIVSISLIVISLLGGSYAMFQRLDKAEYANNYKTGLLQIVFDDTSEGLGGVINVEGAVPTANSVGANLTPYRFKIINQGNLDYKFDLKLVIDADYTATHGCNDKQLSADYIMIKFNDEEPVVLSSLTDNVIKSNIELKAGEDVTYELRAWLKEGAPNEEIGKHYHGKLTTNGNAIYTEYVEPNAPVLAEGMIPIAYDGTNWVKADTNNTDNNWYNYKNKMWANAVMVTSDKRDTYMNANNGTVIPEDDIIAYYVWIPRYRYKLFNVDFTSGTSPQVIDVEFVYGTSRQNDETTCQVSDTGEETCHNKANGNWYTHPAFTFGDTELKGIWVGKFETTGSTTTPTVKPGISSLRSITVSSMYSTGLLFRSTDYLTTNGINQTDAHMMKNIEWGAVAYLKQSIYGLGITDIIINNNGSYYTGGGSGTSYKTNTGQSTTGNITGVYDMSGGAYEYVMGNYGKTAGSSGLTVSGIPAEHIDIYSGTSVSESHLGDVTGETAGWYSDYAYFVVSSSPWFVRGGHYNNGDHAGVFCFDGDAGVGDSGNGFRVVLSTTGA